ncbi:MAG: hypothetical protein ACYCTE_06765 [Acidimicrobiales bacterium]
MILTRTTTTRRVAPPPRSEPEERARLARAEEWPIFYRTWRDAVVTAEHARRAALAARDLSGAVEAHQRLEALRGLEPALVAACRRHWSGRL